MAPKHRRYGGESVSVSRPAMQMTREDKALLIAGKLPEHAVWKFRRDVAAIEDAQKRIARSKAKVAYGTNCGMFPFSEGVLEFQAMVAAGLTPPRALKAGTSGTSRNRLAEPLCLAKGSWNGTASNKKSATPGRSMKTMSPRIFVAALVWAPAVNQSTLSSGVIARSIIEEMQS